MARFQDVRGKLELATRDALVAAGIPSVVFDNVQETPPPLPYAIVGVSFSSTIEPSLGCVADHLQGTVIVTLATAKQQGSAAGEDAAQAVLWAWGGLNSDFSDPVRLRTYNHDGPVTVAPGQKAGHLHTLNCGFTARVWEPPPPPPGEMLLLVTHDGSALVTDTGARIAVLP
jgi:hypothetical protein